MSVADDNSPAASQPLPFADEPPSTSPQLDPDSIMDLDFANFDPAWSFDPIPTSPFLISLSDQSLSSFWPDPDDMSAALAAGSLHFSPDRRFLTCDVEAASGNQNEIEDESLRSGVPNPFLELTSLQPPDVFIIKERMTQALRYFKESTEQHQILAQVWAPIQSGNNYVLRTSGQPFFLSSHSNGLHKYRTVSQMYSFTMDHDGSFGLPGRVFKQKVPEWTPDVQFYSCKEYPRVSHAKHHNVHGSLALPVFDPSGRSCVGVLELIMTSQRINYASEVDKVCKALEAVNLKSSKFSDQPNFQICNEGRQNALAEILEVFTEVCEAYKLPLAQTWIPCKHQSTLSCGGGSNNSCMGEVCMSTTDSAYYVIDAHMWGFRDACAEHHLQKAQGVAGRAFSSLGLCFCEDIRRFSKTDYPLVHYARMFGITGSFAICLRSKYTGDDDYVLEFFFPSGITDSNVQHTFLDSMLVTMTQHFRSLRVASGKALEEEKKCMEIVDTSRDGHFGSEVECTLSSIASDPVPMLEASNECLVDALGTSCQEVVDGKKEVVGALENITDAPSPVANDSKITSERKRGKADKQITLEVLQRYFSGSLKDAAKALGAFRIWLKQNGVFNFLCLLFKIVELQKVGISEGVSSASLKPGSFGHNLLVFRDKGMVCRHPTLLRSCSYSVCPTTMKRICRQNGISRWPSRKINKVNRSLSKLQRVLDSVQGANATFSLTSITPNTAPVAVGSVSWSVGLNGPSQHHPPTSKPPKFHETGIHMPEANPHQETKSDDTEDQSSSEEEQAHDQNGSGGSGEPSNGSSASPERPSVSSFREPNGEKSSALGVNMEEKMPRSLTIKATYREDMIRFRFPLNSNIVDLREEVAKRLKLEVGTFEMKYLDDDHEWVLLSCESDLQECFDVARLSGSVMIRLSIHEIVGNPGSSCGSSGV